MVQEWQEWQRKVFHRASWVAVLAVQEKAQSKLAVGLVAAGMGVVGDVAAAAAEKNVVF